MVKKKVRKEKFQLDILNKMKKSNNFKNTIAKKKYKKMSFKVRRKQNNFIYLKKKNQKKIISKTIKLDLIYSKKEF